MGGSPASILVVCNREDAAELVGILEGDLIAGAAAMVTTSDGSDDTAGRFRAQHPEVVIVAATLDAGDSRTLVAALRDGAAPGTFHIVLIGDQRGPIRNALDAADFGVDRFVARPVAAKALRFAVTTGVASARRARVAGAGIDPSAAPVAVIPERASTRLTGTHRAVMITPPSGFPVVRPPSDPPPSEPARPKTDSGSNAAASGGGLDARLDAMLDAALEDESRAEVVRRTSGGFAIPMDAILAAGGSFDEAPPPLPGPTTEPMAAVPSRQMSAVSAAVSGPVSGPVTAPMTVHDVPTRPVSEMELRVDAALAAVEAAEVTPPARPATVPGRASGPIPVTRARTLPPPPPPPPMSRRPGTAEHAIEPQPLRSHPRPQRASDAPPIVVDDIEELDSAVLELDVEDSAPQRPLATGSDQRATERDVAAQPGPPSTETRETSSTMYAIGELRHIAEERMLINEGSLDTFDAIEEIRAIAAEEAAEERASPRPITPRPATTPRPVTPPPSAPVSIASSVVELEGDEPPPNAAQIRDMAGPTSAVYRLEAEGPPPAAAAPPVAAPAEPEAAAAPPTVVTPDLELRPGEESGSHELPPGLEAPRISETDGSFEDSGWPPRNVDEVPKEDDSWDAPPMPVREPTMIINSSPASVTAPMPAVPMIERRAEESWNDSEPMRAIVDEEPPLAPGHDDITMDPSAGAPPSGGEFARELRRKMSMMAQRLFRGTSGEPSQPAVDVRPPHDFRTEIDLAEIEVSDESHASSSVYDLAGDATFAGDDHGLPTSPGLLGSLEGPPPLPTSGTSSARTSESGEITRGTADAAVLIARMFTGEFTGKVTFRRAGVEKVIFFDGGRPVFASSDLPDDRMGELLYREGKITGEQYTGSRDLVRESGRRMGEILVDRGFLKRRELLPAVRRHVEDVIYSLFAWDTGEYRIAPGDGASSERIRLSRHPAAMVLEGVRRKLDLATLERLLGPTTTVVEVADRDKAGTVVAVADLSPDERAALAAMDGSNDIGHIARTTTAALVTVYHLAWAMVLLGVGTVRRRGHDDDDAPALVGETDLAIDRERVRARHLLVAEADYFALLGVRRDATGFEIRRCYEASRRDFDAESFPPELRAELGLELAEIGAVLDEAYRVLRDDRLRSAYLSALSE